MRLLALIGAFTLVGCVVDFPDEDLGEFRCDSKDECLEGYNCNTYPLDDGDGEEGFCEAAEEDDEENPGESENRGAVVQVPAGVFMMGCNAEVDEDCGDSESPYHEVLVDAFDIDVHEVKAGDYEDCVDAGACTYTGTTTDPYRTFNNDRDNHPINYVNWYEAQAYCNWLGRRLPTEAEWEKAVRGTDGRIYPWGNSPEVSCTHVVTYDGDDGCASAQTMEVGSKPLGVSPYGVMDMIGNVHEWTADWFSASYYAETPNGGWVDPTGPLSGSYRVLRGGSFDDDGGSLRASSRSSSYPDDGHSTIGFRCAN